MNEPTIRDKDYSILERIDHFWTYYKWHTIVAAAVVGILISIIVSVVTKKEIAFQVMAFNTGSSYDTSIAKDFETSLGIDTRHQEVVAQMNDILASDGNIYAATSSTKLMASISASDLDVLMMDMDNFEQRIKEDCFLDLRTVFTDEELSQYPELVMDSDGHVCGIGASSLKGLEAYGYYQNGEKAAAGIVFNSLRVDIAKKFLLFLSQ